MPPQIVLDTNVIFSAFNSRTGLSFAILDRVGRNEFDVHLSVALFLEYQDVVKRNLDKLELEETTVDDILDYLCSVARCHDIHFLWRPFLPDPNDDLILDLAVAGGCTHVVTHNLKHFRGIEREFGIRPVTPLQFINLIGVAP